MQKKKQCETRCHDCATITHRANQNGELLNLSREIILALILKRMN